MKPPPINPPNLNNDDSNKQRADNATNQRNRAKRDNVSLTTTMLRHALMSRMLLCAFL